MNNLLLSIYAFCIIITNTLACNCEPLMNESSLDDKIYGGAKYSFFTAQILEVKYSLYLEATAQIDQIYYGAKFIKNPANPITVYFDIRTSCAITQLENIKLGNKLFITSTYNAVGRMFITNNCDAYFLAEQIEKLHLTEYLNDLKSLE